MVPTRGETRAGVQRDRVGQDGVDGVLTLWLATTGTPPDVGAPSGTHGLPGTVPVL